MLETDTHSILAPGEIAILNVTQVQFLVGDIGLVQTYAPQQVKVIAESFKSRGFPLNVSTAAALTAAAKGSVQLAKRLDAFNERVLDLDVSRITNGKGFTRQGLKKADVVNRKGEIECADDRVVELVDALEGRYFDDGFSDEHRRGRPIPQALTARIARHAHGSRAERRSISQDGQAARLRRGCPAFKVLARPG